MYFGSRWRLTRKVLDNASNTLALLSEEAPGVSPKVGDPQSYLILGRVPISLLSIIPIGTNPRGSLGRFVGSPLVDVH